MPEPCSVEEHLERVLAGITPLPVFSQPLGESQGLAVAADVTAPIDLPPFDNSAMDGYAVSQADVASASTESPVHLPVVGEIGAGQARLLALSPGTAAKIMTGAPIPHGADSVVPYEWTDRGVAQVRIERAPEPGQHVRRAGGDVTTGDLIIDAGTVLGPRQIGLLASLGRTEVTAAPRPRVVIMSTGAELRDPGQPLGHDSIYDGNSWMLAAAARAAGAIPYRVGVVGDDPSVFLAALHDQTVRADIVVTSGGVSMGDYDVVKEALAPLGVWFGPVAMQPGKPQGFGIVGEDDTPILTLPGNPVSAYISFELFVLPALRKMMGKRPYSRETTRARLTRGVSSPPGRRQYLRGSYETGRGGPVVEPVGGSGSHLVGDLAQANCLVVVPEDVTAVAAGEQVQVLLLDGDF